jgi:hypothetical protein
LVHRCLAAKHPLAKQNWAAEAWPGLTVSKKAGQFNENDELSPRKCPSFHYDAACKCFITCLRKPSRLKPEFMCLLQEENKICITFEKWSSRGGA